MKGRRFRRGEQGQAMLFTVLTAFLIVVFVIMMMNAGSLVSRRLRMTNAADASAYSAADWMARGYNFTAMTNVAMAEFLGLITLLKGANRTLDEGTKWVPWVHEAYITGIACIPYVGQAWAAVLRAVHKPICNLVKGAVKNLYTKLYDNLAKDDDKALWKIMKAIDSIQEAFIEVIPYAAEIAAIDSGTASGSTFSLVLPLPIAVGGADALEIPVKDGQLTDLCEPMWEKKYEDKTVAHMWGDNSAKCYFMELFVFHYLPPGCFLGCGSSASDFLADLIGETAASIVTGVLAVAGNLVMPQPTWHMVYDAYTKSAYNSLCDPDAPPETISVTKGSCCLDSEQEETCSCGSWYTDGNLESPEGEDGAGLVTIFGIGEKDSSGPMDYDRNKRVIYMDDGVDQCENEGIARGTQTGDNEVRLEIVDTENYAELESDSTDDWPSGSWQKHNCSVTATDEVTGETRCMNKCFANNLTKIDVDDSIFSSEYEIPTEDMIKEYCHFGHDDAGEVTVSTGVFSSATISLWTAGDDWGETVDDLKDQFDAECNPDEEECDEGAKCQWVADHFPDDMKRVLWKVEEWSFGYMTVGKEIPPGGFSEGEGDDITPMLLDKGDDGEAWREKLDLVSLNYRSPQKVLFPVKKNPFQAEPEGFKESEWGMFTFSRAAVVPPDEIDSGLAANLFTQDWGVKYQKFDSEALQNFPLLESIASSEGSASQQEGMTSSVTRWQNLLTTVMEYLVIH